MIARVRVAMLCYRCGHWLYRTSFAQKGMEPLPPGAPGSNNVWCHREWATQECVSLVPLLDGYRAPDDQRVARAKGWIAEPFPAVAVAIS